MGKFMKVYEMSQKELAIIWKQKNRDKILQYSRKHEGKESTKKKRREYHKEYLLKNRDKINKHRRERCKTDTNFRLRRNITLRIYLAIKKNKKTKSTIDFLGCSIESLKFYLKDKFTEGMTWDNYGKWHIDHIKPCASFDLVDIEQQYKCFHYTNLQPLWAKDNMSKSDKLVY